MDSLLIVNIIAGGFVGYVTKTLAINMLFKEYPIIGGAEIIKDRENLGIAMSTLVEEKLVKPSTLLEEFEKEPFRKSFENLIKHIVENTLNQNINQINEINNIKGIDKTIDNLKNFLIENKDKILESTTKSLFNNINVKNILTKEQIDYIIKFVIQILFDYISNNLEFLLDNFSKEIGNKNLTDFLDSKLIDKFIVNILNNDLSENISIYIESLYKNIEIDSLIDKISVSIKNKKISEILYYNKDSYINYHLINSFINFINSETGFNLLDEILSHIIQILKSLNIPLSTFLTQKIEDKILLFIEKNLPKIIEYLEEWLYINKIEIEKLINEAIDQHLESESPLKQLLGIVFAQKIAERYKLVETALEEIKNLAGNTKIQIINVLNNILENIKISDIIIFLDNKLIDTKALTKALITIINNYLPRIDKNISHKILDKKINNIPILKDINFKDIFKKNIYPYLKEKISEDLSKETKQSFIKKILFKEFSKLKIKNISSLINTNTYSFYRNFLIKNIIKKEIWKEFLERLSNLIPKLIGNKKINDLLSINIKKDLILKFSNLYITKISDFLLSVKNNKISFLYQKSVEIYTNLCKSNNFSKNLAKTLIGMMNKLIRENKLLDGKIFIAVNESFRKFTDKELKQEMDSFMGKELQPIKLLGTILGALIGVGMYFMSFVPGYGYYVTGWWGLLSYSFVYGITEVGTNWLAIKMLFKPYYEKYFLGIKLPFTPGIFPKNKEALAKSMAKFIDQKLLSKDNMIEILERYHNKWKQVIKEVVSKNDYDIVNQTIKKYTKENYNDIAPVLIKIGFEQINKNKDIISNYIVEEIKNINNNDIDFLSIKSSISQNIDYSKNNILNKLREIIFNFKLEYSKNIIEIIPSEIIKIFPNLLEIILEFLIEKILLLINKKEFFSITLSLFEYELKKKLSDLLGKDLSNFARKEIIYFIESTIKDKDFQKLFFDILEKKIIRELSSNVPIKYIFNGKIISVLLNESDFIINVLVEYIINIAKNKKELLVKMIVSEIEKKGLLESIIVKFGGVKKDINGVVNVLIDEKLSFYLNKKKNEIIVVFKRYVKNEISNIKLFDLGLDDNVLNFNNIKTLIYNKILSNKDFFDIMNRLVNYLYTDITKNISINEILNNFDIKISEKILEDELNIIKNHLNNVILFNKDNLIDDTKKLLFNYAINIIEKNSINSLLKDINRDELYKSVENIVNEIYASRNFNEIKNKLLEEVFNVLNKDITKTIDFEILKKDLTLTIDLLTNNSDDSNKFKQDIVENLKWLIIDFIDILNKNIENETKEFLQDILVNSLVDSLRVNNREILAPIDFDSIVRREVYAMDPARIEAIFDFAKPIFRLLIWYGAFGSIIGLGVGFFELIR